MFEWGPGIAPPPPPENVVLEVESQHACKGVNVVLASGYVATNYGRAKTFDATSHAPVAVKSLSVSITYDSEGTFPLTKHPSQSLNGVSFVETSEQLRAIGIGTNAGDVCRGFKVNAAAVTMGGQNLHAEVHTR
jgi:hypothetical protein